MDIDDRGLTTEIEPGEPRPTPVLVHLSGSRRGRSHPLSGNEIKIGTGAGMDLRLPLDTEPLPAPHHATLRCRGATYEGRGGGRERGLGQRRAGEPVHPGLGGRPGARSGRRCVALPCVRRRSRTLQDDDAGLLRLPRLRSELGSGARGEGSHGPHRPPKAVGDPDDS